MIIVRTLVNTYKNLNMIIVRTLVNTYKMFQAYMRMTLAASHTAQWKPTRRGKISSYTLMEDCGGLGRVLSFSTWGHAASGDLPPDRGTLVPCQCGVTFG